MRVLALGSAGGGDDGVGFAVAEALAAAGVPVQRGDATALVELLAQGDVVLIDAVLGTTPGRVHLLAEEDLGGDLAPVSSHAVSVPQAVGLARTLHPDAGRLAIVGVEILPPAPGTDLSPAVAAAVPTAAARVHQLLSASPPDA